MIARPMISKIAAAAVTALAGVLFLAQPASADSGLQAGPGRTVTVDAWATYGYYSSEASCEEHGQELWYSGRIVDWDCTPGPLGTWALLVRYA